MTIVMSKITTSTKSKTLLGSNRYAAIGGGLLVVAYLVFFRVSGLGIPCLFHSLTHRFCPGCGVSRMLLALATGDFYQAFRYNPLLFILFWPGLWLCLDYAYRTLKNPAQTDDKQLPIVKQIPNQLWIVLIVILVGFGILRNLSFASFLAPTIVR